MGKRLIACLSFSALYLATVLIPEQKPALHLRTLHIIFLLICSLPLSSAAQGLVKDFTNLRTVRLPLKDSIRLDSGSVIVVGIEGIDSKDYLLLPLGNTIIWHRKPSGDSVTITYRSLPLDFGKVYRNKNRSLVDSNFMFSSAEYNRQKDKSGKFVEYNQMELNGSYGRSISLGNNQDVVSNSNFNLQVNGYLIDSIKVEAAITDNTVPFQPEGNTSNLQEFDQISIRLSKNRRSLMLGDYNLDKPNSYFLNYTKRVQGLFFQSEDRLGKQVTNKVGLSASMAKGEFARNIFMGQEGNQGPYRLTGNNGEQLFIVLAATEKVYVDNILQERGENADYIINYNTNEIRFMPRRPINQFSRIQVEFEYRTNNYLNSLLYAYDELSIGKKWQVKLNAYSNQDAKNQPFQQNLSNEQKRILAGIGDSVQNALIQNISPDTFAANKILYRIRDTTIGSITYDSVYEYSINPALALYSVAFSYVGPGKGDYLLAATNANGRVYQWVAPAGAQRRGDYTAASIVITPKMHQVLTLGARYQIDSFKKLNVEVAGSNKDPNTFSPIDNATHQGIASKITYEEQRNLGRQDSLGKSDWTLNTQVQHEYVQSRFRAIAPYRSVEFGREWNVPLSGVSPDEHWAGLSTRLAHRRWGSFDYSVSQYTRGSVYKGIRNAVGYGIHNQYTNSGMNVSLMQATDTAIHTTYIKPNIFAEYSFRKIIKSVIGASYAAEHSEARSVRSDSLDRTAFFFDISSLYWRSLNEQQYRFGATYFRRRDFLPFQNRFEQQTHSDNFSVQLGTGTTSVQQVNFTASYRQLYVDDTSVLRSKPEQTILGRLQYEGGIWKNTFTFSTLYEFGTGQEQKRSFTYVQVPAGQGMYNWIDYNNDGVQQLNEFVVALYPDQKLFIRIFTPSNEYVKVNNMNLNQSINFEPGNLFSARKGFLPLLCSRISNQFALQVSDKILTTNNDVFSLPFTHPYSDTTTLLNNISLNNTIYYNRNSPKWGIDYNFLNNTSRQLLTYGLNTVRNLQHYTKLRSALSRTLTISLSGKQGSRSNISGVLDGSSYIQQYWSGEPSLIWLNRSIIRITGSLRYEERRNAAEYGGEKASIQSLSLDTRYSQTSAGVIQLRFTFSQISYDGLASAPVTYAMLDGLKQGNNLLWYLNWQRRLGKGIELLIEYEGRKSATDKAVHTGRMSLRAIL